MTEYQQRLPERRGPNVLFIVLFVGALVVVGVMVFAYAFFMMYADRGLPVGEAVAVVDITGEIFYDQSKVDEITGYRDDDNIKALLLHINSPGGGVAASQALYHAVRSVREVKPVVAHFASVAASGGYYVGCGADSIVSEEGTLTGSIGVIASFLHTEELFQKIGIDVTVIKSGRLKDVGSPHRQMTEEEKAYMGGLLDTVYEQFLRAVSDGRRMPMAEVRELAEGRLYSGEEAFQVGLVDRLGSYDDALDMAARMGGIDGTPRVVKRRRHRSLLERVVGIAPLDFLSERHQRVSLKYIIP